MKNSFTKTVQRKRGLSAYVRLNNASLIQVHRTDKKQFDNVNVSDNLPVSGSYAGHRPGNPYQAVPF